MTIIESGPLPIYFVTIVVKASAVERSFPEGREGFLHAYAPASCNGALFGLTVMGAESVEDRLTKLEEAGIVPGQDMAVADMMHGPMLECRGLAFTSEGGGLDIRWTVDVDGIEGTPAAPVQEASRASGGTLNRGPASYLRREPNAPSVPPKASITRRIVRGGLIFYTGGDDDLDG